MNILKYVTKPAMSLVTLLMVSMIAGCGGGGGDSILGTVNTNTVLAAAPHVSSVTPLPRTTGVPINTKIITATFDRAMDPATLTLTSFTLACSAGATPAGTSVGYVTNGNVATLTLAGNLPANAQCTATVTTAAKATGGAPLASNYVWTFNTGAVADVTPPTVTGTIHTNGQTNVAINTKVGATFSEAMDPTTITNVNFALKATISGTAVAGTVSYAGVNAVFTPTSNLAPNTQYTVTIKGAPSGVRDVLGNLMVADFTISWTTAATPDVTAPRVVSTINANGAINVPINTKVGATFSEAMDPLTITSTNFTLQEKISGAAVVGALSYSGISVIFTPLVDLKPSTEYTATIKGVPNGVKDLEGNLMLVDYVWSWTTAQTADVTRPTVILVSPADSATGVATNATINATFSKAMDPLTINTSTFTVGGVTGLVTYDPISRIATFTPSAPLANGTTYTAIVSTGVKDLAGNTMLVNKAWSFSTSLPFVIIPKVNLGSSSTYGTFGGSAGMTNQGTLTIINGDIGTIATGTSSVTGFHDTEGDIFTQTGSNIGGVNGTIRTCTQSTTGPNSTGVNAGYCALATQARLDAQTAYGFLAAIPSTGVLASNLAGTTINPGVYTNASAVLIQGGDLTLDALGDANAIFVFQIGSTLTVGGPGVAFPQSIILAGGAQAKNVFWQVGTAAIINAGGGGTMEGTIISQAGVTFSTAGKVALTTLNGRALSLGASVTMVNTVINVPTP